MEASWGKSPAYDINNINIGLGNQFMAISLCTLLDKSRRIDGVHKSLKR